MIRSLSQTNSHTTQVWSPISTSLIDHAVIWAKYSAIIAQRIIVYLYSKSVIKTFLRPIKPIPDGYTMLVVCLKVFQGKRGQKLPGDAWFNFDLIIFGVHIELFNDWCSIQANRTFHCKLYTPFNVHVNKPIERRFLFRSKIFLYQMFQLTVACSNHLVRWSLHLINVLDEC